MIPKTPRLAQALAITLPANRHVHDLACGDGGLIKKLSNLNFRVSGREWRLSEESISFDKVSKSKPTAHLANIAPKGSVIMLGVMDAFSEKDEEKLIKVAAKKCNSKLIISWDKDGENGKPSSYVIKAIESEGFNFNLDLTDKLRTIAGRDHKPYGRNLFAFDWIKK